MMRRFSIVLKLSAVALLMSLCCACTDKGDSEDEGKYPWSPNEKEDIRDDSQNPDDKE